MGSRGGGLSLVSAGTPVIESNVISGNSAVHGGGLWLADWSEPTITGNLIVRNHASFDGGGIFWDVPGGARGPALVNNTIAGNDAQYGSGVLADGFDAGVVLVNNTTWRTSCGITPPAVKCGCG